MAALMQLVLTGEISPQDLVKWLQKEDISPSASEKLQQYSCLRQDFIPYFLNFMRDNTLHLIENGLSFSQSPSKTPSAKKPKAEPSEKHTNGKTKRGRLFSHEDTEKDVCGLQDGADVCNITSLNQISSLRLHDQKGVGSSVQSSQKVSAYNRNAGANTHHGQQQNSRHRNNNSTLSLMSVGEDSIIAGSSDTDHYCSRSKVNSTSVNSDDVSPDKFLISPRPGSGVRGEMNYAKAHLNGLGNKQNGGKNGHWGVAAAGQLLSTPSAHSTPDKRKSGGRSKQKLSLGEFLVSPERSQCDLSSGQSSLYESKSGGKSSSGKKKQRNGFKQNQRKPNDRKSDSFSLESLDEFPPMVSPLTPESVSRTKPVTVTNGYLQKSLFTESKTQSITNPSPVARVPPESPLRLASELPHTVSRHSNMSSDMDALKKVHPLVSSDPNNLKKYSSLQARMDGPSQNGDIPFTLEERSAKTVPTNTATGRFPEHRRSDKGDAVSAISSAHDDGCHSLRALTMRIQSDSVQKTDTDELCDRDSKFDQASTPRRISLSSMKSGKIHVASNMTQGNVSDQLADMPSGPSPSGDFAQCGSVKRVQTKQVLPGEGGDSSTPSFTVNSDQSPMPGDVKRLSTVSVAQDRKEAPPLFKSASSKMSITPVKEPLRLSLLDRVGSPQTPDKTGLDSSLSIIKLVQACPQEVTHQHCLDLLVELYSECLDAHLFPNLTVELYFITQLLIVQGSEEDEVEDKPAQDDIEDVNYFKTVHNAVYFAVGVLEKQFFLLRQLDRQTLRLLSENERVADFAPWLYPQLKDAFESAVDKSNSSLPFSPPHGVSFQADTDNRKNFPNDRTFHSFKKQRDLFYEVLREWEAHKQVPGWNMELRLGDKIRNIVGSRPELANYLHLSRLFLSQLTATCKGAQKLLKKEDFENISLLMELKTSNPEKYLKLQDRFFKPFSCGGPCPPASFTGHQQFFRDFIVIAANPVFNQHLTNLLAARITELNETDFGDSHLSFDKHQMTAEDHETECEAFASTLLTVQLLARFLGLLTFLPYQSPDPLPQSLLQDLAAIRNSMSMPLDLEKCLMDAVKRGRLALTVPWMVEFLSLMDPAASSTDCVRTVLRLLRQILFCAWQHLRHSEFSYSTLLIVTSLGWLFDQPCLPEGHFFAVLPSTEDIKQLADAFSPDSLDCLSLVTQDLFYTCCPYFGEMRYLLTEFSVGAKSKTTVRKINLVASDNFPPPTPKEPKKDVQLELQENFFHLHPASLRRTVEFISERTASNFIKYLRANHLPNSMADCVKEVTELVTRLAPLSSSKAKERAKQEIPQLAQTFCSSQRSKMLEEHKQFCQERIGECLRLLLPDDHPQQVVQTATAIACRFAKTKIQNWVHNNITVAIFARQLTSELARQLKAQMLAASRESSRASEERPMHLHGQDVSTCDKENMPSQNSTWVSGKGVLSVRKGGWQSDSEVVVERNLHRGKNNNLCIDDMSEESNKHSDRTINSVWKSSQRLSNSGCIHDTDAQMSDSSTISGIWTRKCAQDRIKTPDSVLIGSEHVHQSSVPSFSTAKLQFGSEELADGCGNESHSGKGMTSVEMTDHQLLNLPELEVTAPGSVRPMSDLLKDGQEILCSLMIHSDPVTAEEVTAFLSDVHASLSSDQELPPQTIPALASVIVQLPIAIVSHGPELWSPLLPSLYIRLWNGVLKGHADLASLHSRLTRNQLADSADTQHTHRLYDNFLSVLVKHGLLTESEYEEGIAW